MGKKKRNLPGGYMGWEPALAVTAGMNFGDGNHFQQLFFPYDHLRLDQHTLQEADLAGPSSEHDNPFVDCYHKQLLPLA
jgi:hypothetical protein